MAEMKPGDMRRELLLQHAQIRALLDTTEQIAKRARAGDPEAGDLQGCIARLAAAEHAHSAREEELLQALMDAEHKQAHARIDAAMEGTPSLSTGLAAVAVVALVRLIRDHMDREEAVFLNERVLPD
jgi:hypothetical protein